MKILVIIGMLYAGLLAMPLIGNAQQLGDNDREEKKRGTLLVKKKPVTPYLKMVSCTYSIVKRKNRSKRSWIKRTVDKIKREEVDSTALQLVEPVRSPRRIENISTTGYKYKWTDTPRVDTVKILLSINPRGWASVKQYTYTKGMNVKLRSEVKWQLSKALRHFGTPGGYRAKLGWRKKDRVLKERFLCEMTVVVASFPLTREQYERDEIQKPVKRWMAFR